MNNYISLIRRSDFNDLYKYGHLFVQNAIPFEGDLDKHANDKSLFKAVTAYMNTYEYSTEYLILHFTVAPFVSSSIEIFIKDVVGVFALDQDAHISLSASLDPRINLQISCWSHFFKELSIRQLIRQSKAGKYNCYEIFGIEQNERDKVDQLLPKYFEEELFNDLFANKRPEGDKSIWMYLLRYERHSPYWNDMRGLFSDAIHVYENFKQKHEIDYEIADEVPISSALNNCGKTFSDILRSVRAKKPAQDYNIDGCDYFVVAALFLYMKNLFKEKGITTSQLQQIPQLQQGRVHEQYGLDFAIAVGLLGITLGQELSYSCYYEVQKIGIFDKSKTIQSRINQQQITDPSTGDPLSSDEIQNLLNRQNEEIANLTSKVQELEKMIQNEPNDIMPHQEQMTESYSPIQPDEVERKGQQAENVPMSPNNTEGQIEDIINGEPKVKNVETHIESQVNPGIESNLESKEVSTGTTSIETESGGSENHGISEIESNVEMRSNETEEPAFEPVRMKKLTQNKKKFNSRVPEVTAYNKAQYNDYYDQGYRPIDYFDSTQKSSGTIQFNS